MTLHRSATPDFTLKGVVWECWITEQGTYEWRSTCGQYGAIRKNGAWRARRGDRVGTYPHRDLKTAMRAAQAERKAAA